MKTFAWPQVDFQLVLGTRLVELLEVFMEICLLCRELHEEAIWNQQRPHGHRSESRPSCQQSERKQTTWLVNLFLIMKNIGGRCLTCVLNGSSPVHHL